MYSVGEKVSFTTDTATALYSIAKYFGVKHLQNEVRKFCLEDMQKVETCGTYFEHVTILQVESILEAAAKFCHGNLLLIDCYNSRLKHAPDPQFWLDVMKGHAEKGTMSRLIASFIVCFCNIHAVPGDFSSASRQAVSRGESHSARECHYFA
jgi:hypothetical protein